MTLVTALTVSVAQAVVILMALILSLPNEIIKIVETAPSKRDQATLRVCRTSQLFHSLILPVVNSTVLLILSSKYIDIDRAFCSALITNPNRADTIRSFEILDHGQQVSLETPHSWFAAPR
jgi:hypothetical protein